ncbi:MAG TPA: RidA family protein [Stellaceae bacterium]|nr:RidA family protein [Stellaceae bacterium]
MEHRHPTPYGYSQTVITGGGKLAFVSGQIAMAPDGAFVGAGDFSAQSRQVHANLAAVLDGLGAKPAQVIKLTTFIVDLDAAKTAIVRADRLAMFGAAAPPASSLLGVSALYAPECLLEIEMIVDLTPA